MTRSLTLVAMLAAVGLGGCFAEPTPRAPVRPMRVVSLDYCADQYVLKLLPRARILAVSPDAGAPFSYMRAASAGVPRVRARAEDVLLLRPDLVVRSYGGGAEAERLLADAGVPVLQLGYAGDLGGVRRVLLETAAGLGVPQRGAALAADMDARLARLASRGGGATALYMTPGGVTSGPGTLVDALLRAAGLRNFQHEPGWRPLPLERLAYAQPGLVAAADFAGGFAAPDRWSAARHPVARAQLAQRPVVALPGAWTACGGWFILDAVEALAGAGL